MPGGPDRQRRQAQCYLGCCYPMPLEICGTTLPSLAATLLAFDMPAYPILGNGVTCAAALELALLRFQQKEGVAISDT